MPLPFHPEPIESLRSRLPKALEHIWTVKDDFSPMKDRPGLHRENVFDFESGLRLLISKDALPGFPITVHVSTSWEMNLPFKFRDADNQVKEGYAAIGGKGTLKFLGVSERYIPHWTVVE